MRRCRTCREPKPRAEYPTPTARRCAECSAEAVRESWCRVCEVPVALTVKGEPRRICDRAECLAESRARSSQQGRVASVTARKRRMGKRKRCPWCDVSKPRTREHYSVKRRHPDGSVAVLDNVCKPCRSAATVERYHSDPERRAKALERASRQREAIMKRVAEDPEFAEEWREQRRRWDRERAARLRRGEPPVRAVAEFATRGGPKLPAEPLADVVEREASCLEGGLEALAPRLGVSSRRVRAWRAGERVELAAADRVLTALDLLWWDVWDPERFPEVADAFEGEAVAA